MPTNGMTIDSLNTVSSLTAQDEVPVWDKEASGEHTRKITAQNMANSVKTLGSLVNTTEMNTAIAQSTADVIRTGDVVNNLTSTATGRPLSANMGKALNEAIAQSKAYTYLGEKNYNESMSIPSTAHELYCVAYKTNLNGWETVSAVILPAMGTQNISASGKDITVVFYYSNGTISIPNQTNVSKYLVYYR